MKLVSCISVAPLALKIASLFPAAERAVLSGMPPVSEPMVILLAGFVLMRVSATARTYLRNSH
jgi:hypothetical protein